MYKKINLTIIIRRRRRRILRIYKIYKLKAFLKR